MNRKMRCDCKLQGLPEGQRVKVDAWLFDEGRTYEEVVEGCLREFGLKVSKSSVGRYYERVSANRFAKVQREKRMALEPELSPAEEDRELAGAGGFEALETDDEEEGACELSADVSGKKGATSPPLRGGEGEDKDEQLARRRLRRAGRPR